MPRDGKIEVRVCINGQPVNEYSSTYDEEQSSANFGGAQLNKSIESVPNTNYEIELNIHKGFSWSAKDSWDIVSFAVEIDGVKMAKFLEHVSSYEASGSYKEVVKGAESCKNGVSSVQKFKFEPYKGGQNFARHGNVLRSMHLGRIKVEVSREKYTSPCATGDIGEKTSDSSRTSEIMLKERGIDTTTSLGSSQRDGKVWVLNTQKYDVMPMITFNFAYASRDVLEHRGVFDRPASPRVIERECSSDAKYAQLLEENRNLKIKIEEGEKSTEMHRREARRAKNLEQLRGSDITKRSRSPSPFFFSDNHDEIQEIKRPKVQRSIEVIVLDD